MGLTVAMRTIGLKHAHTRWEMVIEDANVVKEVSPLP
jgi:peroxiredoxin